MGFGGLAASGYVTGSGPVDPRDAAAWRRVYQPHSVRIGDMWYSYQRLGVMGLLAGVAADFHDIIHQLGKEDALTVANSLVHAIAQNILDESFMKGPADLIQAIEDPGRYGEQYLAQWATSLVPFSVGMAQLDRAMDPYTREARTVLDSVRAKIPGASENLMPRRDIWGEPIANRSALGGAALTAIYEQAVNRDPVNAAMVKLGVKAAMPPHSIRNVQLTDQQYDDFSRIAGRMAKLRLDAIVRSAQFLNSPGHTQHDIIVETIRGSRETARGVMMQKYPEIAKQAMQNRLQVWKKEDEGVQ